MCALDEAKARTAIKGCSQKDLQAFRSLMNSIAIDVDAPLAVVGDGPPHDSNHSCTAADFENLLLDVQPSCSVEVSPTSPQTPLLRATPISSPGTSWWTPSPPRAAGLAVPSLDCWNREHMGYKQPAARTLPLQDAFAWGCQHVEQQVVIRQQTALVGAWGWGQTAVEQQAPPLMDASGPRNMVHTDLKTWAETPLPAGVGAISRCLKSETKKKTSGKKPDVKPSRGLKSKATSKPEIKAKIKAKGKAKTIKKATPVDFGSGDSKLDAKRHSVVSRAYKRRRKEAHGVYFGLLQMSRT